MMNQTVQQTTQKLLDLLPDNEEHYRLDELRSWGIPPFIVQRIQVELERNLAESMILPTTDWANIQTAAVQDAWRQFVQAIRDEARLPASYAKAVMETAAADVLDMLTEPRKNIPDVIFGSDDELSFDTLQQRAKAVVVYQHFATLLPRYMQRKQLEVLSRERCEQIIRKTDERLASNYSPLNWAQMLDPLFNLLDDQIDPALLRLFFEDKDRPKVAAIFDRRDEALSRAEFIEILSAPDLRDTQPGALASETPSAPVQVQEEDTREPEGPESEEGEELDEVSEVIEQLEQSAPEASPEKETEFEKEQEREPAPKDTRSEEADSYEDESLNTNFATWGEPEKTSSKPNGSHDRNNSISALFSEEQDQKDRQAEVETEDEPEAVEPKEQEDTRLSAQKEPERELEQDEEEDPIWMRFMSEDEKNELVQQESEEDSAIDIEEQTNVEEPGTSNDEAAIDEEDEEPTPDQRKPEKNAGAGELEEMEKLERQLEDRHDHFVKAIFEGSEQAYDEAMKDIVEFESWREASKYIQKNIFSQNRVDLYSESAVAFTDRLQNYFLAKENRMNG